MSNTIGLESIKTEKQQIETKNPNIPHVETYGEFWNILTNQKKEALFTKVDNLDDITIVPDSNNNLQTPETNKYAIQKTQQTQKGNVEVQLCYITGKSKIEHFLGRYVRQDILHYKKMVQISIQEDQETSETYVVTQEELATLANEITNFSHTPQGVKEYFQKANTLHKDIKKDYNALLKEINDRQKIRNKSTLLERSMLQLLEHKHTKDTRNMDQLDRTIHYLGKEYKREINEDTREQNAKGSYLQLLYYRDQANRMTAALRSESAQKNFVDNPDMYMDIPVESGKDALLLKNIYNAMSKERFRINQLLTDANFKNIKDKNGQTMQEYLTATLEDGATAKEAFVPSGEYQQQYDEVLKNYPQLQAWMKIDPTDKFGKSGKGSFSGGIVGGLREGKQIHTNPQTIEQYTQRSAGGLLDKLTPGPLTDLIDRQNFQPKTKENLKTAAGLAFLVGAGFLARKAVSNIFKSKEKKDKGRGRYVAGATLLFGGSYISSGNMLNIKSLTNDIADLLKGDNNTIGSATIEKTPEMKTVNSVNSMNIIFGRLDANTISNMLTTTDDGKTTINYEAAKAILEGKKDSITNVDVRLKTLENLEKNSDPYVIHLGMEALGLSLEKLANDPTKTYEELAEGGLNNFMDIAVYMKEKEYKRRNPELTDIIYAYMKGDSSISLDKLAKMGAFEKDEIILDNDALKNNIQSLTMIQTDEEKKELYLQAYKVFKEIQDPNSINYKGTFEFTEKDDQLYLKTYNKETPIDLEKKQLGSIPLYTTYQTLKAANLTNRLQDIFAGKTEVDEPFNISGPGRDIEFKKKALTNTEGRKNPRQFIKGKIDTEALEAGPRDTLQDIAPSLEDHKQAYVDYLNTLPGRKK